MKHSNISIFIPHAGCPHKCSFCNQKTISGSQSQPHADDVHRICSQAMTEVKSPENTEIAFFGGSFTAIDRSYMLELLEAAKCYIGENKFKGIRISTRPDFIDREVLEILKSYGVTAIELGAQSMVDKVLEANDRGHTAEDVYKASELIREYGFELGLQMMVGLYKSTIKDEQETMEKIIAIHPDTLRIYPVAVLEQTRLAQLFDSGEYKLLKFDEVVKLCTAMLMKCHFEKINVIKCGLHASEGVEGDKIAGFYHPAFREICESMAYRVFIGEMFLRENIKNGKVIVEVNPSCISKAIGHKKSNIEYFHNKSIDMEVKGNEKLQIYQCEIRG